MPTSAIAWTTAGEAVGRLGAGRAHPDPAGGVLLEQGGRHLTAPRVVHADEQDLGRITAVLTRGRYARDERRCGQEPA